MKKPVLSIDEPEPRKAPRADRPPIEGFAVIVDRHFKTAFDTMAAAEIGPEAEVDIRDASDRIHDAAK